MDQTKVTGGANEGTSIALLQVRHGVGLTPPVWFSFVEDPTGIEQDNPNAACLTRLVASSTFSDLM
jgi:hypothetical protein